MADNVADEGTGQDARSGRNGQGGGRNEQGGRTGRDGGHGRQAQPSQNGVPGSAPGVQSIDRAMALLSVFSTARPVVGVSELARATGLARGTAHRLVTALVSHGLLTQVPETTSYCLGPRLLGLADVARQQISLEAQAGPVMAWLRDRSSETVGLHILDDLPSRRTIAQAESPHALRRTYTDLGSPRPPYQGAPGKLLLAFADERLRRRVLDGPLPTADGGEELEPAALAAELASIREDGFALSLEERVPGVVAMAVPVRDHRGAVAAALSISIPSVRAGRDELLALVPLAREAGGRLSARLGHTAGTPRGRADGSQGDVVQADVVQADGSQADMAQGDVSGGGTGEEP
ncbi:IclR family transcriptional regulator [Streptomyces sp. HNM0575]|uniref:IclR family transcriptional regulator domain-containing protein n=1 Tax=Streptomyces sp. HNM0575 TaxID=2716338 RepID=UPI00145D9735|nr:IclR family transcriptional regulator [Streptomyces sp. HNM0575]